VPATDRDRAEYLSTRGEDPLTEFSEAHHAEALALVRSFPARPEQQAGEVPRRASPPPATLAAVAHALVPSGGLPTAHLPTGPPGGVLAPPRATDAAAGGNEALLAAEEGRAGVMSGQDDEAQAPPPELSLEAAALAPEPGTPLAGLLPLDTQGIRRHADAFFTRLADLVRGPADGLSVRALAPWLLLAGAVAWEAFLLSRALRRTAPDAEPLPLWSEDET
jgi:hypothetical protein